MGVGDQVPAAIEQLGAEVAPDRRRRRSRRAICRATTSSSPACAPTSGARICVRTTAGCSTTCENGGTVIVQYNKLEFNQAQYGPYPAKISDRARHRRERAGRGARSRHIRCSTRRTRSAPRRGTAGCRSAARISRRARSALRRPASARRIRFRTTRAPRPARWSKRAYGKGRWIYIGLGLWRQLPAGTDGAYQLLANLLSLGKR